MTPQQYDRISDSSLVIAPMKETNNYDAITETTRCVVVNTTSNRTHREFEGDDSRR